VIVRSPKNEAIQIERETDLVARKQIILRLLNDGAHKVQSLSHTPSLSDLLGRPFAGAPIESPTLVNHVIHGPHGLFNGRLNIRALTVDEINIFHIEMLEVLDHTLGLPDYSADVRRVAEQTMERRVKATVK
jgi:hypothetical protein